MWPCTEATERGPQISKWMSSKLVEAYEELEGKGKCLCLAKWHKSQVSLLLAVIVGYNRDIVWSLWWDKWPSPKYHKASLGTNWSNLLQMEGKTTLQELLEKQDGSKLEDLHDG